jgi:hypothetical protein
MLKLALFVLGAVAGAGAATAWLTSDPEGETPPASSPGEMVQPRLHELTVRLQAAQTDGARAGQYTEEHLRRKLDAYRKGATSSTAA